MVMKFELNSTKKPQKKKRFLAKIYWLQQVEGHEVIFSFTMSLFQLGSSIG